MMDPPEPDFPMSRRAKLCAIGLVLGPITLLLAAYLVVVRMGWETKRLDEPDPCDLDRRFVETAGTKSVDIRDRTIPGARLIRFHRNSVPAYAEVYGCEASGELLDPSEVFARVPHGSSAEALAAHHAWAFAEGGLGRLEILTTEDRFVALGGTRAAFAPPALREGVVSFWRADTYAGWGPEPLVRRHVVDAQTGLGGASDRLSWGEPPRDRASLTALLARPGHRSVAFAALAADPRPELLPETLAALELEADAEMRYLGLLAVRGLPVDDGGARLAALAEGSVPLVRMGVVQALATLAGPEPRARAAALLQRETDPRTRRVMVTALADARR